MKGLLNIFLGNPVLANIMMALIIAAGVIGGSSMVREIFPKFSLDTISVTVAYPGADPDEIEEGICIKLEEALDGLEGIKELTTTAAESVGSAFVELKKGANLYQVMNDVKNRVDSITTFPVDAEKPSVSEMKFRGDVGALVLWGKLPERQLKELARKIEREVLQLPGVTQASISGIRDYQIAIEIHESELRKYGLNFEKVREAVAKNGLNLSAGTIQTGTEDYRIRVLGRKYAAKDYRDIPVVARADGTMVKLGQVADIRDTFDEDSRVRSLFNGEPSVSVNVFKTEFEDAIKIADELKRYVERKRAELPPNVNISLFRDGSRMILDRMRILIESGRMGLVLVFLALWMFLDLRLSFWVTMGIPVSLAGGLALMSFFDCSINMLSLFGLIMVLGIIVDDAIVVGESIYARRKAGAGMYEASIDGTAEVAFPVVAAVLTTIIAFIPLFLVDGVMGKFIRQIPIPVVAALSVSLVEGLFILPVHLRHLPLEVARVRRGIFGWPERIRRVISDGMDVFVQRVYLPFLKMVLHWRYVAISVSLAMLMLVYALVISGVVKFVFFPKNDGDVIRAEVELLPGTPESEVLNAAEKVNQGWEKVAVAYRERRGMELSGGVYSVIGDGIDWGDAKNPARFVVVVEMLGAESRDIDSTEVINQWKEATGYIPGLYSSNFQTMRGGPGGNPVEFELRGGEMETLLAAANELLLKLKSIDGLYDQKLDWKPGKREFVIRMKPEAHAYGLSLEDIASYVRGGFYGAEALRIQRGRDDVKVKVKFPEKGGRNSIDYFKRLRIKTASGARVPFNTVAEIKLQEGPGVITRKDRQRVVTVSSDINDALANAQEVYRELGAGFLPGLLDKYNHEINYSTSGQAKEMRESFSSLGLWFPLCLFGIYFVIASIFRSYIQPVVIMVTIPYGLVGGVVGHMLFGLPLTILSMFGMVALAGIVVNDAIVLIDGVNCRLESGMGLFESLCDGGRRRFRAIFLTTFTTFVGLMPIMLERSFQAQFLKPMAISIAFGVLFATLLTLVLIPCLFAILNDFRRVAFAMIHLRWPEREEVEPRATRHLKEHNEIIHKEDIPHEYH